MQNKKKSVPPLLSPLERENYDLLKNFLNSLALPKKMVHSINQEKNGNNLILENNRHVRENEAMIKKQILTQIYQALKGNNQLYQMLNAKEGNSRLVEEKTKEFICQLIRNVYEHEKNESEVLLVI